MVICFSINLQQCEYQSQLYPLLCIPSDSIYMFSFSQGIMPQTYFSFQQELCINMFQFHQELCINMFQFSTRSMDHGISQY